MRENSISYIRLIAMIMIIFCHIFQGLDLEAAFWLNLGVQIFLFISGYLYGKKQIEKPFLWFIKSTIKILVPFIVVIIAVIFINHFFLNIDYEYFFSIFGITIPNPIPALTGGLKIISHTWFIFYIMIAYLITPFLQYFLDKIKINNEKQFFMVLFLITLIVQLFSQLNLLRMNAPWILTYIWGYMYSHYYMLENQKDINFRRFIIAITILFFPIRLLLQYGLVDINLSTIILNNKSLILDWHHVFCGISIFLILHKLFNKIDLKSNSIMMFSDQYSYYIYLVHQIYILNELSLLQVTNFYILNILMIFLVTIINAIILEFVCSKIIFYLNNKIKRKYQKSQ